MIDIRLNEPGVLLLLPILLPALLALWYFNLHTRKRGRLAYGEQRLVKGYSSAISMRSERGQIARWLIIVCLALVAMAQPTAPGLPSTVNEGSLQVVAVIDVSTSMATEAYRAEMVARHGEPEHGGPYGHNIDRVKELLSDQLLPAIAGNELGIITYRGDAMPRWELTDDLTVPAWILRHWIRMGEAPVDGSNYAAGLERAIEMFDRAETQAPDRVIVLFSDGGFTGDPARLSAVLNELRNRRIRLVVIAMGPQQPQRIPTYDRYGRQAGWLILNDEVQWLRVDEALLRQLAQSAGGEYIRAMPGEPLNIEWASTLTLDGSLDHRSNIYQYPLGAAMLVIVAPYLRDTTQRIRRRLTQSSSSGRRLAERTAPATGRQDRVSGEER